MIARRSTARRCMALLVGLHATEGRRISRDQLANALRRSVRTVHTVLKRLEARGWIEVSGGGNGTAGYITVINAIAWQTADVADDRQKTADVSPKPMRIRALVLTTTTTSKLAGFQPVEIPPPTITNEYGRVDRNPAHVHIMAVLRAARWRIQAADNPEAYMQAILRRELGHEERKPPQRETGETGRVEGIPVGSSGHPGERALKSRAFAAGGGR